MCVCKNKCNCNITSTTKGEKGDASPSASLGYKVYTALLTQAGTDAPVAETLNNTLGFIPSYTYSEVGQYVINGTNFPANKTVVILSGIVNPGTITKTILSTTQILLFTYDDSGASVDLLLEDSFIEIRIYN